MAQFYDFDVALREYEVKEGDRLPIGRRTLRFTFAPMVHWPEVMLTLEESDKTVADLITDGCNMGVKSLNRYLNQYEAAEEQAKDIAKRLIGLESHLAQDMQSYL